MGSHLRFVNVTSATLRSRRDSCGPCDLSLPASIPVSIGSHLVPVQKTHPYGGRRVRVMVELQNHHWALASDQLRGSVQVARVSPPLLPPILVLQAFEGGSDFWLILQRPAGKGAFSLPPCQRSWLSVLGGPPATVPIPQQLSILGTTLPSLSSPWGALFLEF